jgi:signal transduction histidine kinase
MDNLNIIENSKIAALEQLLSVFEQAAISQSDKISHMTGQLRSTIDELEKKEALLEKANTELKNLDKEKDEFISLAAHELKTPLASIKGFAQVLTDDKIFEDREKSKYFLGLINKNTDTLFTLILDIVDASRISLGKLKINLEEVDPYPLFDDIRTNMEPIIRERGVEPAFTIGNGLPKIWGDGARIAQILRNLLTNSIHYMQKGGKISLNIFRAEKFVQFEVGDTGTGIPEENKKYIFSRFYQVDSSLTRKIGGSGLGLSICQGLVELMNGNIWFESEVGKGTAFFFRVPLANAG